MGGNPFDKLYAEILSHPVKARDDAADRQRTEIAGRQRVESFKRSLGSRYAQCSLESFMVSDDQTIANRQLGALASLQSFVDALGEVVRNGSGLFLYGAAGTGKDHLQAAVMLAAVDQGVSVLWVNGLDIFAAGRDAISEDTGEGRLFERLTMPTVLAISDPVPPVGDVTLFQRALLQRVIDARYRQRKPTWVTINVANRDEADSRLGVQLADRLTDGALCIHCNWPSHRLSRRWAP